MKRTMIVLVLLVSVFALAGAEGQPEPVEQAKTYDLRIALVGNAEQTATKAFEVFKEEIERTTNGQITVEIHHSASLFAANQIIPAMMRDNLEMAMSSPASLAEFAPYMSMFTAGYLFTDYDHMSSVMNGKIGRDFFERVAKDTGIRPLTSFYLVARQINLRQREGVMRPEDLAGITLRMPGSDAYMFLGRALGANPTPLAFGEVYLALRTGTIDGQDNPLPATRDAKFYEVTQSITLTNHYVSLTTPIISEKLWQEMGPELQEKIAAAMETARQFNDETIIQLESELVDFFKAEGLNIVEPDVEAFASHVREAYRNNTEMTASWDMDLFNQISNM